MSSRRFPSPAPEPQDAANTQALTVLLVDDQPLVGETVRRMLAGEADIDFHYCSDPTEALRRANEVAPTAILQDLVMPEVDGLTLVRFFRANPRTRDVPLIVLSTKEEPVVKAEAFALGANDYLVKLPDKIELVARIRYHSRGYIALRERNEAYRRLAESRRQLADEIEQAARYVRSLLPQPIDDGPVRTAWRFVPSTQLGGDSFGYHWLDEDHFAIYLLDVSGHGVGASLMSVSAMNVIGSQSLPNVEFREPARVLDGLCAAFDMEKHDGKYFTMWYGVYRPGTRTLVHAGAGHPPAALFTDPTASDAAPLLLESTGPPIGFGMSLGYDNVTTTLPDVARLFLFSDGAFEIQCRDGGTWTLPEFLQYLSSRQPSHTPLDDALEHACSLHGSQTLDDDCSIVQCDF
jgi:sigma-B regulation protein RsbU (phosphoserine phosphatase)